MDFVLFFAMPFLTAVALGYALKRFLVVLAIGLLLGFAFFLAAYLGSPTDPEGAGSDAGEFLGRWWEPFLVGFFIVLAWIGWVAGAGIGRGLGRLRRRLEPSV